MDKDVFSDWDWAAQGFNDEEQPAEEDVYLPTAQPDGLLFLIDCSAAMFVKSEDQQESCFEMSLKCVINTYKTKVISSHTDMLSLVFYGTKKCSDIGDGKSIFVFQDLGQLNAKRILELDEILLDTQKFREAYGSSSSYEISDVFWSCSSVFSKCARKSANKRILLFTNEDNPHRGDPNLQRKAAAKATDLREMDIDVDLMNMNKAGTKFSVDKFYRAVLYMDEEEAVGLSASTEKFSEMLRRMFRKIYRKRVLAKLSWTIGDGLEMAVGVYCLTKRTTPPAACKIHRATNAEVQSTSRMINKETGDDIMPQDVKLYQVFANKRITIEKDELDEAMRLGAQGLKLIGFKPRERLKPHYHINPSHFISPDEKTVKGSTQLFSALLQKCLERDVIPVCWYRTRINSRVELVYLLPQREEKDESGNQLVPPGFHVIFMPFGDDFREVEVADTPRASTEQVDLCKALIKKLQFPYEPNLFENPALQTFFSNLEAMALSKNEPDAVTDYTLPNYAKIEKRVAAEIKAFSECVFPENYDTIEPAKKRTKPDNTDPILDGRSAALSGQLHKKTVAELKAMIKTEGIKTSCTKKADLIDAINAFYNV